MKKIMIISIMMLVTISLIGGCVDLSRLLEGYNTGDTESMGFTTPQAQTFYLDATATMRYVKLKMFRVSEPGEVVVSIQETGDDGKPTDTILSIGTFDGDSITTDLNGEWVEIDMPDISLTGSVIYSVVVDPPDGGTGNIRWRKDETGGTVYTKGSAYSLSGVWTEKPWDYMFEIYGK